MRLVKLPHTKSLSTVLGILVIGVFMSSAAQADKFDDAVNHYLKGFESCKEASGLLRSNQVAKARSKLSVYQKHFKEAQKMDASIVKTKKRGMEGNILFCQRVGQTLEVEEGSPFMDKAIEHCDLAQKALKAEDPTSAQANLDQFKELSSKAFEVAPSMKDIFSIASQVRRCERLQKKVARVSQKQETENLAMETVKEESASYIAACLDAEKQLGSRAVDDALLKTVKQSLSRAKSHKKNTQDESKAFEIFKANPDHEAKAPVESNLSKGDQCIAKLQKQISGKERELRNIKSNFDSYSDQLASIGKQCETARSKAQQSPSDTTYVSARKTFQQAQVEDKKLRAALKKDKNYGTYSSWPQVKNIDKQVAAVDNCMAATNKLIGGMFAQLQAKKKAAEKAEKERIAQAKAKAEAEAKAKRDAEAQAKAEAARLAKIAAEKATAAAKVAAEAKAKAAAEAAEKAKAAAELATQQAAARAAEEEKERKAAEELAKGSVSSAAVSGVKSVTGTIKFDGLIAEHAVFYVEDGSKPPRSIDIELDRSGFDKGVYLVGQNTQVSVKNKDNSLHRIKANDEYRGYSENLIRVYPRQKKNAKVEWPLNTMVAIRSERGALSASYIAHIASSNAISMEFNVGSNRFDFNFKGSGKGTRAFLIMPGYDTIEFNFAEGGEQVKPIVQNGAPAGSVKVSAQ